MRGKYSPCCCDLTPYCFLTVLNFIIWGAKGQAPVGVYAVGDKVWAKLKTWVKTWPGKVEKVNGNGTTKIHYIQCIK